MKNAITANALEIKSAQNNAVVNLNLLLHRHCLNNDMTRKSFIFSVVFSTIILLSLATLSSAGFGGFGYGEVFEGPRQANSVGCGNNICEQVNIEIGVGEEKTIQLGDKSYRFKIVSAEKETQTGQITQKDGTLKEEIWYSYKILVSVDGGQPMTDWELREKLGFSVSTSYYEKEPNSSGPEKVMLFFREEEICGVPDCAFRVELPISRKWNLVPQYMIMGSVDGGGNFEALKKGTCKVENFRVIYIYNPVKKTYVKLLSYGIPAQDLSEFARSMEEQGIIAATPLNSVLLYSTEECKLVVDLPKSLEKLLLILTILSEQAEQQTGTQPNLQPAVPAVPEEVPVTVSGKFLGGFSGEGPGGLPGFAPGWNFFSGSKDMEGKSFEEIKGTCVIEKAFSFDSAAQEWKRLTTAPGPETGFIFKVKDKCLLGFPEIAPPEVPAGKLIIKR